MALYHYLNFTFTLLIHHMCLSGYFKLIEKDNTLTGFLGEVSP